MRRLYDRGSHGHGDRHADGNGSVDGTIPNCLDPRLLVWAA
jgi:hypothetical protein